jgi:hypothetical protein
VPRHPSLFQINTRVWLNHLSRRAGKLIALAYNRDGSEIVDPGLYIDHAPWQYNVFKLRAI